MKLKKKSEYLLSVENLTNNNIVCEFALCTSNLLDRCLHEFKVVYEQRKKSQFCYTITTQYTLSRTKIQENH